MSKPAINKMNFDNTEIAFRSKSYEDLKGTFRLFKLMNNKSFVKLGTTFGIFALRLNLPFTKTIVRKTIFKQFVGGEQLLDCEPVIARLKEFNTLSILDYGAEAKSRKEDFDNYLTHNILAIELAASNNSVPCISIKISALADNDILVRLSQENTLDVKLQKEKDELYNRVNKICSKANELGVAVLIDAEESWMQNAIDQIVLKMMERYNKDFISVYNTYQLYRKDKLAQLKSDHENAKSVGFILGAKLVRGAYMEKERKRASIRNEMCIIHKNKSAVDNDFNEAIEYCVRNHHEIASICASHNIESNLLQAQLIEQLSITKDHPHINFCQLYGMSDYITFNLAENNFNVAKYIPYGALNEVVPYLIRRAKENSAVTGEMSRELSYITRELKRRKL